MLNILQGFERELAARQAPFDRLCNNGEQLIANGHPDSRGLKKRIKGLRDDWQRLDTLAQQRRTRLEDAAESHQVNLANLSSTTTTTAAGTLQ